MSSTSPDVMQKIADVPRSVGELASIAPTHGFRPQPRSIPASFVRPASRGLSWRCLTTQRLA